MPKILLISVGGSPQPIVTSITTLHPDRVIFLCTTGKNGSESQVTGKGLPCEVRVQCEVQERWPNLPTHLELGDRFQAERDVITLDRPDDVSECYQAASKKIREIQRESPDNEIIVDYTGGTKSMSFALGMAGIDYGLSLYVTTATERGNIQSVSHGELPERVPVSAIAIERFVERSLPDLLARYDYPAIHSQLAGYLTMILPRDLKDYVRAYADCCRAFDAWERFDYHTALNILERFEKKPGVKDILTFLKRVMHSRAGVDEKFTVKPLKNFRRHGYEIVEDLLMNAERREIQGRYDEAVGRLYRALELVMQIRFRQHYGISTRGVSAEKLKTFLAKEAVRTHEKMLSVPGELIVFGSKKGYELLRDFSPEDPLGQLYKRKERKVREAIAVRNLSIFAHGFQPIGKQDYKTVKKTLVPFIDEAIAILSPQGVPSIRLQFPNVSEILSV